MSQANNASAEKIALVLPGGGARAAYQVGVLRAIAELLPPKAANPFPVVTGTSAGAINATYVAIQAHRFRVAVANLDRVWRNFQVSQVFAADTVSMLKGSLHWLLALLSAGWLLPPPKSLFDNSPLRELLIENFDFDEIDKAIAAGHLEALSIAAAGYASARSVAFFQSKAHMQPWQRVRRSGLPCKITVDHLMANVAVPFLFPAVLMGDEYYGDGSMRQGTPFSSAIHLGANRLLVVATRDGAKFGPAIAPRAPSFGQIFGFMLDALFTDGLYADYERLAQLNSVVDQVGGAVQADGTRLRRIDLLVINPSRDISQIARSHVQSLPRTLRVLLRTMGAMNASGGELMSYLMFQGGYTRELIALGYRDGMDNADRIASFLRGERVDSTGMTGVMKKLS